MYKSELNDRVEQIMDDTSKGRAHCEQQLKKLLKEAEKNEDIYAIGNINLGLSVCAYELGKQVHLFTYACKAVGIFENSEEVGMLVRSYNFLGIAYGLQENYQQSLACYNKALEVMRGRKKTGVRREMLLNNIADCFYNMREYQKGIRILKKCINSSRRNYPDNHVAILIYSLNLSSAYEGIEDYEKALKSLDSVKETIAKIGEHVLISNYYARRACVLYKLGDETQGRGFADQALNCLHDSYDLSEVYRELEKIADLQIKNGDYTRAQKFCDALMRYAGKSGKTSDHLIAKRIQGEIFYCRGELDKALAIYQELNELYEQRMCEQNEMQYQSQKQSEEASNQIRKLLRKIRLSEEKAERDPLTGLLNRSALVRITSEFIQKAKANGNNIGSIFLDIDYFKEYNDTYGHAAGDEAIKFIAGVCCGMDTSSVKFFRYGGDEFFGVVLGHKDRDLEQIALDISEAVRSSGYEHVKNPNGQHLTVSIGVVNLAMKNSEATILDLVQYSDLALYHAKDYGKDVAFALHPLPDGTPEYKRITDG